MGTVRRLTPAAGDVTLGQAAEAYLVTLGGAEQASTRRTYGRILRRVVAEFGAETAPDEVDAERFAEWFRLPVGRPGPVDVERLPRARALSRVEVDQLLTRKNISLRERTLWRMLYETAARSAEVLALDIEDLDLPNRCARVRRKGGAIDIIVWQTGTARLLPRLLQGRTAGPLFVTERKARVQLPAADLDERGRARLSYQQAEALFAKASGGATLHQLRHFRADARRRDRNRDTDAHEAIRSYVVRSLVKYAQVSAEALMRHQAERDPARRR